MIGRRARDQRLSVCEMLRAPWPLLSDYLRAACAAVIVAICLLAMVCGMRWSTVTVFAWRNPRPSRVRTYLVRLITDQYATPLIKIPQYKPVVTK